MDRPGSFTNRKMGLDSNVWLVMLVFMVLATGLFGYNVANKKKANPCVPMAVFVNERDNTDSINFEPGQSLSFRIPVPPGNKVVWDFGNNVKKEGSFTFHTFTREDRFTVQITVNNECTYTKRVNIKTDERLRDSLGNVAESIEGVDEAITGVPLTFTTQLPAANYEWYIDNNSNFPAQHSKEAKFEFKSAGTYVVVLRLDYDNKKKYTREVRITKYVPKTKVLIDKELEDLKNKLSVGPKKPVDTVVARPPEIKKEPVKKISEEIFKSHLQSFLCGDKIDFNQYLCQKEKTPVIVNKKHRKTFETLCTDIYGKKIVIESVVIARDEEGCIINLSVEYDEKGRLARHPCKN